MNSSVAHRLDGSADFYYCLTEEGSANPPVIADNVGPYASLEEALADWTGYRVSTEEELEEYERYWDAYYENGERTTVQLQGEADELVIMLEQIANRTKENHDRTEPQRH